MAPVFSLSGEILFQHHFALINIFKVHRIFIVNDVEAQVIVYNDITRCFEGLNGSMRRNFSLC